MIQAIAGVVREADARIWKLAAAETLVWASIYYLFPALMVQWEQTEGWTKGDLSLTFSAAIALSALGAPIAGRWIDRGHGRLVLTGSAALGGFALMAMTRTDDFAVFFALWLVMGVAMAGCLYEPCFAFITHLRGEGAQRAITLVTLAAGFASTIAFPLANVLASVSGWQGAVVVFGGLVLGVAVPLFWSGAREPTTPHAAKTVVPPSHRPRILTRATFWLLALAFSTTALAHSMLISHLLPLLTERGVGLHNAVFTASLIGPMQVVGRIALMTFDRRASVFFVAGLSFVSILAATTSLLFAGTMMLGLMVFAVLQGAGYGVTSITKPVVTARVLGRQNFGAIAGALAVPYMMAYALAPSMAAGIWRLGGYDAMVMVTIALPAIGLLAFWQATRGRSG